MSVRGLQEPGKAIAAAIAPITASAVHDVVLLGSAIGGAAGGTKPQRGQCPDGVPVT